MSGNDQTKIRLFVFLSNKKQESKLSERQWQWAEFVREVLKTS
jgi:hypothetical protein